MTIPPQSSSIARRAAVSGETSAVRPLDELLRTDHSAWATRTAIQHSAGELSYAELHSQAELIAQALLAEGVQPGDRVGVLMRRDALLVPSLLGLLRIGVAYVPLDASYPAQRLQDTLAHAEVQCVLCSAELGQRFLTEIAPTDGPQQLDPAELIARPPTLQEPVPQTVQLQDSMLANLIYTSGTTGAPKGVSVSRLAMANLLLALQTTPGIRADDRVLGLSTIAFDIHVFELLAPLACGATIVLADDAMVSNPASLLQLIEQSQVTLVQATPSMWGVLLSAGLPALPHTRGVAGGERLAPSIARALSNKLHSCWNMYGPTEACVYATAHLLSEQTTVSIGRPLANVSIAVVAPVNELPMGDPTSAPAKLTVQPVGERGELVIYGAGLADGYWQNPHSTAERFITIDINDQPVRAYLTGDLAYIDSNGNAYCEGRLDQQIKLRGHRIELSEIEHTMVLHPDLSEAACSVHSYAQDDDRLIGYYTNKALSEAQLRNFVSLHLPPYMVPQRFLRVRALPRLASGKLDRTALPRPQLSSGFSEGGAVVRRSAEQQALADGWRQVLGGIEPRNGDNFMDLGGHSLLGLKLVQFVLERTGKELPLRLLVLENFAELVAYLEDQAPISASAFTPATASAREAGILGVLKMRFRRLFQRS